MRPVCAILDAGALRHNLQVVRRLAPTSRVLAIVKANGYGHGLVWAAKTLSGADGFGVACLEEGLELRAAGIQQEVCLLEGLFNADEIPLIIRERLTPVVHEDYQLAALGAYRGAGMLDVWVKIDTGMHRIGFPPHEVNTVVTKLQSLSHVRHIGLLSHFANAEEKDDISAHAQLAAFSKIKWPGLPRSMANSAGILNWPHSHWEWVRPGLMLYGVSPLPGVSGTALDLRPVMTLKSQIISVRMRAKGDAIGYGGTYRCSETMPVGVVAIGYGDGYPRELPHGAVVRVRDTNVPIIGRVSMDMLSIDLRAIPDAAIGDAVTLWGTDLSVESIAQGAGTIPYTLLCGLTQRLPRREQG